MLRKILHSEDCAKCQMCCKFELDELVDAPTFSEKEMIEVLSRKPKIKFAKKQNVYQIILEQWRDKYICPLLTENGCMLGNKKPFDCKAWPFYVMKKGEKYVVTLTKDCPVVNAKSSEKIKSCIDKDFLLKCHLIIKEYPDMIMEYNRDMLIVCELS